MIFYTKQTKDDGMKQEGLDREKEINK